MPDAFEVSFSNLAYSYLQEKALNLLEYLVGFEVVDKDDMGTRGFGIFAFKIGDQYLYAPVFFLSGEIKPLELLYLKDKDIFIPLSEDWVDYLLKNKPLVLGEGEDMTKKVPFSQPDLDLFATPPITGKHITASLKEVVQLKTEPTFKALYFLKEAPPKVKEAFYRAAYTNRDFLTALEENYGWDLIKDAAQADAPNYRPATGERKCGNCSSWGQGGQCTKYDFFASASSVCDGWSSKEKAASLRLYDGSSSLESLRELSPEQREAVFKGKMVFAMNKQAQEEEATLHYTQFEDDLQNPHSSGVYRVVDQAGDIVDALVLKDPQGSAMYGENKVTVINLSNKRFVCAPTCKVWVKKWAGVEDEPGFDDDWERLQEKKKTTPVSSAKVGSYYILVNRAMNSSAPFVVKQKLKSSNGLVSLLVDFVEGDKAYPKDTEATRTTRNTDNSTSIKPRAEEKANTDKTRAHAEIPVGPIRLVLSPKVSGLNEKIYLLGDEMIVPATFELLQLTKPTPDTPKFAMGGPAVIYDKIKHVTKVSNLKLWNDGVLFTVEYDGVQTRNLTKKAAVGCLAGRYRVNPELAYTLIAKAEGSPRNPIEMFVKQSIFTPLQGAPNGIMDPTIVPDVGIAPKQILNEELITTPNAYPALSPMGEGENIYAGPGGDMVSEEPSTSDVDLSMAMQASQMGQQQVFDHALLGVLAKNTDLGGLVHKYIPDMEKALDRLGRLLFLYWWHHEEFKKLFGILKLTELEDQLRNVFKSFGELILELKKKERIRGAAL